MKKIVEVRQDISSSSIEQNVSDIQNILTDIKLKLDYIIDINEDDYNYLNTVLSKTKLNLNKVNTFTDSVINEKIKDYRCFHMYDGYMNKDGLN